MIIVFLLAVSAVSAASTQREESSLEDLAKGLDPNLELTEDEFLEVFHIPPVEDQGWEMGQKECVCSPGSPCKVISGVGDRSEE